MKNAEQVRRDNIEKALSRLCDEFCRFPRLVRDQHALDQICEACPTQIIEKYIQEEQTDGTN